MVVDVSFACFLMSLMGRLSLTAWNARLTHVHLLGARMSFCFPHSPRARTQLTTEVASTFNEALLQKTLRASVSTDEERMMLVNAQLDDIRGTFFRQTQLADFELAMTRAAEAKTPLTPGFLKSLYARISADYIGPDVAADPEIELEFSRIPHFHARLYVYQYATSLAASAQLADRVLARSSTSACRAVAYNWGVIAYGQFFSSNPCGFAFRGNEDVLFYSTRSVST